MDFNISRLSLSSSFRRRPESSPRKDSFPILRRAPLLANTGRFAGSVVSFWYWIPAFAGMTVILLALVLALPTYANDEAQAKKIEITATPIELNTENPQQKTIGKLKYIKGYYLTSNDAEFGGISGLVSLSHRAAKPRLHFVTDQGFVGQIYFNKSITIQRDIPFIKIPNLPKNMRPKVAGDAESITIIPPNGSLSLALIAFEQMHRIIVAGGTSASHLPLPAEIGMLQSNGGLETMEALSDGRLLLMAEHPTIKSKQHFAWIGTAPKDDPLNFSYITRLIAPPEGYSPTDATELPNGDVLVLLRRFTPADGVSAKFWRISKAMLDESGPITGEVIATLKPPLTVDNMEGIAVIDVSKDGNPIIAVISDNNFNPLQRTLLMIFEVMEQ